MIPFIVAEALRRARRRDDHGRSRTSSGPPMWRLLAGEAWHLMASRIVAPRAMAVVCGAVAAIGVTVALGPTYPGPVAPAILRGLLATTVAASAVVLARWAPPRWRDLHHAVRRERIGLAAVMAAAALSVFKVGLHEVTPGPVLPGPARWAAVTAFVVAAILLAAGHRSATH